MKVRGYMRSSALPRSSQSATPVETARRLIWKQKQ
jgi:hypothetical protein